MTALPRISLVIAGALWVLAPGMPQQAAAAASKVFTVANYPVEATAKDAVAAKEKALADGQQAALGALLKRLVPVTAYNRLDHLKAVQAANYIDGVAVRSEQNSSTRYIASLDFSFQADAIRDLLSREGVPFVEDQAPRMVLVPVTAEGKEGSLHYRAASGSWAQVWKGLDLENTLTPVKVESLLPVIHEDTIVAALNGDDSVERVLTGEYKADYVLFAIAEVQEGGKELNVTLAGIDAAGLVSWRRAYKVADGDVGYTMELAAVITQGVLEGRWKVAKLEEAQGGNFGHGTGGGFAGGGGEVHMSVAFTSPDEWNDLRGRILDLPGVDDVRIGVVSARTADVSVRYPGGGEALSAAFSRQGLTLTGEGGYWTLRSGY
ncbi:DUF2066 domain-containing protein [uncultured Hyphomicrobium sp.]|uniref:DUF2066 domain-containing protein n=1 Tax=uncultured Hyphomicrobium sp. TaxID=194373 RepID=UPI0025D21388|nr:DUF2066 domain-containing protein [uncultured Hyphomicrobium sp.]